MKLGHKFVIKKNNNYTCIANDKLKVLDMMNYLPPGTSYDQFLETFNIEQRKSFFPYEYLSDVSVLKETALPPPDAFYSTLKQQNVLESNDFIKYCILVEQEDKEIEEALDILNLSRPPASCVEDNYKKLLQIWESENMSSMLDYLNHYNSLDVEPMLKAVDAFKSYFIDQHLDIFKDCISVPGIARKMLFKSGEDSGGSFALINRRDEDLYDKMKSSLIGGPSIVTTRYHEVGETFVRENAEKPCKSIEGYDFNSLYLFSMGKNMPTGNYVRRKRENDFRPDNDLPRYTAMYDWMEWVKHTTGKQIKHKMNKGAEIRVGPYLSDGYVEESRELWEYLGCYFHGHTCKEWKKKEQQKERYDNTLKRLSFLENKGYTVHHIWECDFKKQVNENDALKQFIRKRHPTFSNKFPSTCTEEDILTSVLNEDFFGFLEVDIRIPNNWEETQFKPKTDLSPRDWFDEMAPLFVTSEIPYESIGSHMRRYVRKQKLSKAPRTLLVGGLRAKKLLLFSPLLKWYIEQGLVVTSVYEIIEFSKQPCFSGFVDVIADARRAGDANKSKEIIGILNKLIGNASFGCCCIDFEKYLNIKYVDGFRNAAFAVNNPRFVRLNELSDDIYETEMHKVNIKMNMPIQIAFAVLNLAKLFLLKFYYEFLLKFVGRENFEYLETDTDSSYVALAGENLEECILPEMKAQFDTALNDHCKDDYKLTQDSWFPRSCCTRHNKYDARTPGIMKIEWKGSKMICLCSKSYVAVSAKNKKDNEQEQVGDEQEQAERSSPSKTKFSLKGVNRRFFVDPTDKFESVLKTKKTKMSINRGIRLRGNSLFTYEQTKKAFVYFYCKRKIADDGIHSRALDIELTPKKRRRTRRETDFSADDIV